MALSRKAGPIFFTLLVLAAVTGAAWEARAETAREPKLRPGAYVLDRNQASLNWLTSDANASRYRGAFTAFDARLALDPSRPERTRLALTIDARSIESADDRLDDQLRAPEVFDTARHPTAEFRTTRVLSTGPSTARVFGDLTLKGVTRPVELDVRFKPPAEASAGGAQKIGFSAATVVDRTEFGVAAFAPSMSEHVRLTFNGEFARGPM